MFQKLKDYRKYILPFVLAAFLLAMLLNSEKVLGLLSTMLRWLGFLAGRFIAGFGIAYALNFLVVYLRKRLKIGKAIAITFTYFLFFGFIAVLFIVIVPMVAESVGQIMSLVNAVPHFYLQAQEWFERTFVNLDEEIMRHILDFGQKALQSILSDTSKLVDFSLWEGILRGSTRFLMNIFFAVVVSIYALNEKDSLNKAAKRFVYAILPLRKAHGVIRFVKDSNRLFSQYLIGKVLGSLIVGVVSAIAYMLLRIPQAGFLALLAGITNTIPYFGPVIGASITVFILLFYNVPAAMTALVVIVILQTIDGWYLEPKILGNAVGISPLLTIIAIALGGDLMGFLGILLGVPIVAVLKLLLYDRYIARKLDKRREDAQLAENAQRTEDGELREMLAVYDTLEEPKPPARPDKASGRKTGRSKRGSGNQNKHGK